VKAHWQNKKIIPKYNKNVSKEKLKTIKNHELKYMRSGKGELERSDESIEE
jgi:hypothetical protein